MHARTAAVGAIAGAGLTAMLATPALAATAHAGASSPAASAAASPADRGSAAAARERSAVAGAIAGARATGRTEVVSSLTTKTTQVTASPRGTLTSITYSAPVRVRSGNSWKQVSAVLHRNASGTWSPVATPSGLALSGGGSGPMAVLTSPSGGRLAVGFPVKLPAPQVSGATATYRNVLPGATLRLTATTFGGVTQTLIISSRSAAASPAVRRLRLSLAGHGLHLTSGPGGSLTATGPHGVPEFTSSTPLASNSETPPAAASSAAHAQGLRSGSGARAIAQPSSTVASGALTIATPASTLTPASGYTAAITDSFTPASGSGNNCTGATCFTQKSTPTGYTEVKAGCPTQTGWDNTDQYGSGIGDQDYSGTCDGVYRAYFQIDTTGLEALSDYGAIQVQNATFSADENYGADWTCSDTWPATLHLTTGISSSTDWNNKPSDFSGDQPTTINAKPGPNPGNSACTTQLLQFNVTYAMNDAISGNWPTTTLGIQGNETNDLGFMRIGPNPSIITTFDLTPPAPTCNKPASTTEDGSSTSCDTQIIPTPQDSPGTPDNGCASSTGWVNQTSVKFDVAAQAAITGEDVSVTDNTWDNSDQGSGVGTVTSAYYPTSGTNNITAGTATALTGLLNGHAYAWNAWATVNADGTDTASNAPYSSARSATCHFNVDTTPPGSLAVASTQFPSSGTGQDAGTSGTFTFSATDPIPTGCTSAGGCSASGVNKFAYTLNGGAPVSLTTITGSAGGTQTAQATIPVGNWGTNILSVTAEDNAGNITTTPLTYTFYAPWNPSQGVTPGDITGDGVPDLLATTNSGGLNLYPGPLTTLPAAVSASSSLGSPDNGTDWNTYQITHRGSVAQEGSYDDLFAHKASNLYIVLNNPSNHGAAPQFTTANPSSVTTVAKPACAATTDNSSNCTTYPTGNWASTSQILAPGDAWAGDPTTGCGIACDTGLPSLLTVENGALWLYQGQYGNALANPIELGSSAGTTNWSGMTLIAPGQINGHLTLWARDNATGAIYAYAITLDAKDLPTLNPATPATPIPAEGTGSTGTAIPGFTLTQTAYPDIASTGDSSTGTGPSLYAIDSTGKVWRYPGTTTGTPSTSRTQIGTVTAGAITQLS